jgi:HK97 family phage prohead protease
MTRETKEAPQFTKEITDRLVTGVFAVHGNVDDGMDRSHPGAFADTKVDGRDRVRFLWQHDSNQPPIAVVKSVRELARSELPPAVLAYAPEATGGAEVVREYLDTPRGNEVLAGLKAGAIQEMSYAYDVAAYSFTEEEDTGRTIRELQKLRLFDISDVSWGMNPATVASKGLDWKARPFVAHVEAVEAAITELVERITELKERREKEGRMFSSANFASLQDITARQEQLAQDLKSLLAQAEPKRADPPTNDEARRLWLAFERTRAQLNGVILT